MINKIDFIRKIKKNRLIVLIVSVIVICGVYFAVQKAIDAYVFNNNSDIVLGDESIDKEKGNEVEDDKSVDDERDNRNWFEKLFGGDDGGSEENENDDVDPLENNSGTGQEKFSEEEIDLELEGAEGMDENINESDEDDVTSENVVEEKIYVYITGEINVPGVVVLNKGSRIVDAINAAGGTTVKANISKVNLVFVLEDGMKVNIPNNNDLKNNPDFEYITMASGDGATDGGNSGGGSRDYGSDSGNSGGGTGGFDRGYSVVNINTATQTELESLPGIGPSLALKIINYRMENGKFSSIEDIKNVNGIGESKFEGMKKYIRV